VLHLILVTRKRTHPDATQTPKQGYTELAANGPLGRADGRPDDTPEVKPRTNPRLSLDPATVIAIRQFRVTGGADGGRRLSRALIVCCPGAGSCSRPRQK